MVNVEKPPVTQPSSALGSKILRFATWSGLPAFVAIAAFGWLTHEVRQQTERLQAERVQLAEARTERDTLRTQINRLHSDQAELAKSLQSLHSELDVERKKLSESKQLTDLVQEIALGARTPEQRSRVLYTAARNAMEAKDDARAKALLIAALSEQPMNADALNSLGLVTARTDPDWHAAERLYLSAIKANPNYYFTHYNLALLYEQNAEPVKAHEFVARALAVKPDYGPAKSLLKRLDTAGQ